jgi:copper chaperone
MNHGRRQIVLLLSVLSVAGLTVWYIGQGKEIVAVQPSEGEMGSQTETREFAIEGMGCQGCADHVTEALAKLQGVRSADVSLQDKKATVVSDPSQVSAPQIEAAIAAAGYQGRLIAAGLGR